MVVVPHEERGVPRVDGVVMRPVSTPVDLVSLVPGHRPERAVTAVRAREDDRLAATPGTSPYPASDGACPARRHRRVPRSTTRPYPVRVMWTPDAQADERVWFTCQDKVGELLVVIGLAFYPNLGTAEAYAIVNVRGGHTTVRAHKECPTDRMDMSLGPFHFEVLEPFRKWRLSSIPRARHRLRHHLARYEATRLPPTGRRHRRRRPRRQPGRRLRRLRPPGGLGRGPRRALRPGSGHPPRHPRPSLGYTRRRRRARPLHGYATPAQR